MTAEEFNDIIKQCPLKHEVKYDGNAHPQCIIIHEEDLTTLCAELFNNSRTYFDMLSCLTGLDNGPAVGTMEVIYNLYSIPFNYHLMIKVILSRDNPAIDSVSHIWKTADWHEREVYDMFGIHVRNHSDLRRILMPADWEGHPLRKDYKQQAYYRDIKLEY